jgi:hypothetical protein
MEAVCFNSLLGGGRQRLRWRSQSMCPRTSGVGGGQHGLSRSRYYPVHGSGSSWLADHRSALRPRERVARVSNSGVASARLTYGERDRERARAGANCASSNGQLAYVGLRHGYRLRSAYELHRNFYGVAAALMLISSVWLLRLWRRRANLAQGPVVRP